MLLFSVPTLAVSLIVRYRDISGNPPRGFGYRIGGAVANVPHTSKRAPNRYVGFAVAIIIGGKRGVANNSPLNLGNGIGANISNIPSARRWPPNCYFRFTITIEITWDRSIA